jgi:hypothetical protein
VFNLQPGMGVGFLASKQIALGLGYAVAIGPITPVVLTHDMGGAGLGTGEDDHRLLIIRDDEEILGIITNIVTSGIL